MSVNLNNVSEFTNVNVSISDINDRISFIKSEIDYRTVGLVKTKDFELKNKLSSEIDSLELRLFELEDYRRSFIIRLNESIKQKAVC